MRFTRMELSQPPSRFFVGWGDVHDNLKEWIQAPDSWLMILYGHKGVATVNGRAHEFSPEKGLLFPPHASCGHLITGHPTPMANAFMVFPEPTSVQLRYAVPIAFDVQPTWYDQLLYAAENATVGAVQAKALAWHILWSIARPMTVFRDEQKLYDAEDIIRAELASTLRVPDLAKRLDVSQSTLLQWFQAEHGTTVQGFIRQARAREACRLLAGTNLRLKEIAARVGVPDLHQFNKLVRRHSGLSPRAYREMAG